ncbi:ABC_transporter family protein [Hexamita inflata]|uniref:ABC transporter family protein n=1 Tax=Hexamita inflata TaxID=28002 RepID=A0AA86QDB3_9EUKA|nr:ABC transporter family protein [Hexamita inflata]
MRLQQQFTYGNLGPVTSYIPYLIQKIKHNIGTLFNLQCSSYNCIVYYYLTLSFTPLILFYLDIWCEYPAKNAVCDFWCFSVTNMGQLQIMNVLNSHGLLESEWIIEAAKMEQILMEVVDSAQ